MRDSMQTMKAKGWNFQTFKSGYVGQDTAPLKHLPPTGIDFEKEEGTDIQTNKDENALYPVGFGLNTNEKKQQKKKNKSEPEPLLPAGVKTD